MSRCKPPPDIQDRYDEFLAAHPDASCGEIEEGLGVTPFVRRKLAKRWYAVDTPDPAPEPAPAPAPAPPPAPAPSYPPAHPGALPAALPTEVHPDEDPLVPWEEVVVDEPAPLRFPVPAEAMEPIGADEALAARLEGAEVGAMAALTDEEQQERDELKLQLRLYVLNFPSKLADVCGPTKKDRQAYLADLAHLETDEIRVALDRCRLLVSTGNSLEMLCAGVGAAAHVVEGVGPYVGMELTGYGAVVSQSEAVNDLLKEVYIKHVGKLSQYAEPEARLAGVVTAIGLDQHNRAAAASAESLDERFDPAAGVGDGSYDDL